MSVAANRYARALLDVLYPQNAEAGLQQLQRFSELLKDQPTARRLLENPTFSTDPRRRLLKEISDASGFDRRLGNFIYFLTDRHWLTRLAESRGADRTQL